MIRVSLMRSCLAVGVAWGVAVASVPAADAAPQSVLKIRELLREDRWQEAVQRSAQVSSGSSPALRGAALEALFRAGRLGEVERRLEHAGEELDARGWLVRARISAASGRGEETAAALAKALAGAPEDPEVLYWAADLESDSDRVRELFRRYLAHSDGEPKERIQAATTALAAFDRVHELQRSPWRPTARPDSMRLPLRPVWGRSGSIDGYTVEAKLGPGRKTPVRLLLDTGAHSLFVLERIARKRGFEPVAEGEIYGGGGDRSHDVRRGLFSEFRLGEMGFADALGTTVPRELDPTGRFHGLLGLAIFGGYRVTLDLPGRELRLSPDRGKEPGPSAESTESEAVEAPYWWISGQLLVEVEVAPGRPELFVLDTGATSSVVSLGLVDRIGDSSTPREGDAVPLRAFGGEVEGARTIRGIELRFGDSRLDGEFWAVDLSTVSRIGGVEVSGMLGLDALRDGVLTLSTDSQRLEFGRPQAKSKPKRRRRQRSE